MEALIIICATVFLSVFLTWLSEKTGFRKYLIRTAIRAAQEATTKQQIDELKNNPKS